jgi:hypothetical protein
MLIQIMNYLPFNTNVDMFYGEMELMPICNLYKYHVGLFAYSALHGGHNRVLELRSAQDQHDYETRTRTNLCKNTSRTNYGLYSIKENLIRTYNNIPNCIRMCSTYRSFKLRYKSHILH